MAIFYYLGAHFLINLPSNYCYFGFVSVTVKKFWVNIMISTMGTNSLFETFPRKQYHKQFRFFYLVCVWVNGHGLLPMDMT